jgi:hypothetical protein
VSHYVDRTSAVSLCQQEGTTTTNDCNEGEERYWTTHHDVSATQLSPLALPQPNLIHEADRQTYQTPGF